MKHWLNWTYVLRLVGLLALLVGFTGVTWPPHVLGSVVIAALGFLFGPDAVKARENK